MSGTAKTVVVTGAASGIGRATALKFALGMADVFTCDLQYPENIREELGDRNIRCAEADVRNIAAIQKVIDHAVDETGRLDVLVNNASVGLVRQIGEVTEADWRNVMDTNLKAAFFGCKAAIFHMSQQSTGGAIVNVASNAGLLPRAHDPVYSISKMSLIGLTRSLALCHSKHKIRVNAVCPGPVGNTTLIEENFIGRPDRREVERELIQASPLARALDRLISPEEVADSIVYLASDAAQMISGTSVAIDGGKSLGVPPE